MDFDFGGAEGEVVVVVIGGVVVVVGGVGEGGAMGVAGGLAGVDAGVLNAWVPLVASVDALVVVCVRTWNPETPSIARGLELVDDIVLAFKTTGDERSYRLVPAEASSVTNTTKTADVTISTSSFAGR